MRGVKKREKEEKERELESLRMKPLTKKNLQEDIDEMIKYQKGLEYMVVVDREKKKK